MYPKAPSTQGPSRFSSAVKKPPIRVPVAHRLVAIRGTTTCRVWDETKDSVDTGDFSLAVAVELFMFLTQ